MINERFVKFLDEKFVEIINTRKKAHKEYAFDSDVFHNFNKDAQAIDITPLQSLYILMAKHQRTIARYIKGDQVEDRELIEGRIKDNILYLFLLWAMVEESRLSNVIETSDTIKVSNSAGLVSKLYNSL